MRDTIPTEAQELHAYVDGQLSPEARTRLEERLATDAKARQRVHDYEAIRRDLRSLFDPMLGEPVPTRLRRGPQRWQRPLAAVAASLLLLLSGTWIGLQLQTGVLQPFAGLPQVVREAVMAYTVYTPEVRHPVEVPGEQEQHLVAWLTKRIGAEVRAPALQELGYRLVGGRLLAADSGPGALFMYENNQGRRVTLYVRREQDVGRMTNFRYAEHEKIALFYWQEGTLSYALAGEIGRAGLLRLVELVYRQIIA